MQTFETPGEVTLQVLIPSGKITVEAGDAQRTEVELVPLSRRGHDTIEQIDVTHEERAGRHVVRVEQRERIRWGPIQINWGGDVEVKVVLPAGAELELSGAATDIRADGRFGVVAAKTASGDIRLGEVDGRLDVKTASGDVSLDRVTADQASLVTVSGDVEIGDVEADLTLRTVSGDVTLRTVREALTVSTTSGDVELRALEGGDLRVQSVSGDVRVGIGQGTRIFVDATSVSGRLDSELEVGGEAPADEGAADDTAPVVPVHVKTVSGDVSLVRAPAPVSK